ncbi:ABC transporter permease [Corynebacterium sp. CCUG 65737]|uniref:ABC transporter permease n=1 Tax=Corynebacterium sp. CCUG 65737 TaxID=2823889 RepID=UPI002109FB02|nr:ABC transporter permease [Corynebacterium sp. CCUG 65737]MCQ4627603.1 ABC transporter permease [Corynebacterium sp. CCUG 65737]
MMVEIAKLRRTKVILLGLLTSIAVLLFSCINLLAEKSVGYFSAFPDNAWGSHLVVLAISLSLMSPLQLALIASRAVDTEHASGGWMLNAMAGVPTGSLLRRKLLVTAPLVTALKTLEFSLSFSLPILLGAPLPPRQAALAWFGFYAASVITSILVLAVMLILSAVTESQVGVLALGVVGGFLGVGAMLSPPWLAAMNPFGYFAVTTPYRFSDTGISATDPSWMAWLAYLTLITVGFLALTRRLNRKEV